MPDTVLIVEGHGDVASFPHLVGKVGAWLGMPLFIKNPIRAGGWGCIKKPGGVEKMVSLAASRPDCERIIIVVDLDDGCPVAERESLQERVDVLQETFGKQIEICFCIREFEAWFLRSIDQLAQQYPELDDLDHEAVIESAGELRDAKGALREALVEGYSESIDQAGLISSLDPPTLFARDRSFRRFVKALSGLDYDTLQAA